MLGNEAGFVVDMSVGTKEIYLCAHVEGIACGSLAKRDIDGETIVVHATAIAWIAHVNGLLCASHYVPHLLLNAHRTRRIIDLQAQFRPEFLQGLLSLCHCGSSLWVKICFAKVGVEHLAGEVVGPAVHQTYLNRAINRQDIDQSLLRHSPGRLALLGKQASRSKPHRQYDIQYKPHITTKL